jgi:hypothetical protein
MKRLCLLLAGLALLVPAGALAQGPPSGPGGLPPIDPGAVAQALEKCRTAPDLRACVRAALGLPATPAAPARPESPRGRMLPLVPLVAGALCRAELKATGVDAFKAKYRTRGACLQANAAKAAGIVEDVQTQCASAERKGRCVLQALAKALGLPARGPRK